MEAAGTKCFYNPDLSPQWLTKKQITPTPTEKRDEKKQWRLSGSYFNNYHRLLKHPSIHQQSYERSPVRGPHVLTVYAL